MPLQEASNDMTLLSRCLALAPQDLHLQCNVVLCGTLLASCEKGSQWKQAMEVVEAASDMENMSPEIS